MTLLLIVGAGITFALYKILEHDTHTRRVDPASRTGATCATCTVPTCPNRGDWAVNGTDLCIDHMLVINGRKS